MLGEKIKKLDIAITTQIGNKMIFKGNGVGFSRKFVPP